MRFKNEPILSVSTIGSFLTIARFFTILITPSAKVTVTTIGRPSGIAATARLKKRVIMLHLKRQKLLLIMRLLHDDIPDPYGEHVQNVLPLQPSNHHDHPYK